MDRTSLELHLLEPNRTKIKAIQNCKYLEEMVQKTGLNTTASEVGL